MATFTIKPSKYDQKRVTYVDRLFIAHSGVVIGQSPDGRWYYVRSDSPEAKPAEFHFKMGKTLLLASIVEP